ncbi:MAG: hypothetical protein J5594_00475 [Elusimicrobiaceae bacterium]|nr:hypothetical protein [Elusimicrobiaceae bacterium]
MKKYILMIFSAILLFNLAQAKDFAEEVNLDKESIKQSVNQELKDLSNVLTKEITDANTPFKDDRVRLMCSGWPICKEWVKIKFLQDSNFKVTDAEVERWISKWEDKTATWEYKFYVQTEEKGQTKAYLFTRGIDGLSYNEPILIKKFPGHPVPYKPSEKIAYPEEYMSSWPGMPRWKYRGYGTKVTSSQYIYKYDEQGNALWERRLYVKVWYWFSIKYFYFRAYQTKADAFYNYEEPVEINTFPSPAF